MPEAVAHGRRPENASLGGLPAAYIVQQVADFKNGHRKSYCGEAKIERSRGVSV